MSISGIGQSSGGLTFSSGSLSIEGSGQKILANNFYDINVYPDKAEALVKAGRAMDEKLDRGIRAWWSGDLSTQEGFKYPISNKIYGYHDEVRSSKFAETIISRLEEAHKRGGMTRIQFEKFQDQRSILIDLIDLIESEVLTAAQEETIKGMIDWADCTVVFVSALKIVKPIHFGYRHNVVNRGYSWNRFPTWKVELGVYLGDEINSETRLASYYFSEGLVEKAIKRENFHFFIYE